MDQQETPHIAILPSPGMGHLIPLVEFAKRLAANHRFTATFIIPTDGPLSRAQRAFLESLPDGLTHLLLPPVRLDDLPDDVRIETRISVTVARSLPPLRDVLEVLAKTTRLVSLVVDLFGTDAFDIAEELDLSPYIFFPSTAMNLSLILYLPELDRKISCEYKDSPDPIRIPGSTPLHGSDLLDPLQDRKDEAYKWVLHHGKRYRMAEGIMVNSFKDLEPGAIKYLQEPKPGKPPVYPIGPLIQMGPTGGRVDGSECLRWLDEQPRGSVLFISFGSGGTLSFDQLHQLALGLEMSGQRFLWVVRSPNDKVANASFFSAHSQNDPFAFLPNGFIDRTKGYGLVVPNWAPQPQVLSHGSTGGFLSHCGWNSTLESVVNGVPLITWPLYAEQKMNAVILAEDLKVALRPRAGENGLIGSAEIARVVKGLLQGEESKQIRSRMRDLKEAAGMMLSRDGESTKLLTELAQKWRN
ncbi:hydroquinone glucosyltransferase-like [Diospyros lotus]|uniref:hydroquinone glucosyltransferase-like n=1 Tax=Diospyros lotus TaxID=55363 RepID=UPI00224FA26E|nr:hydroquinone glucosyltransferase-like [Diospyros lotus]